MGKKKVEELIEPIVENISVEPLEDVMGDRYATYAKYVIQDRAIPDVRDGMKPVQRRIIFSMYKSGNTINKPTKKCAHTVGAVMGTFHPHGDTSIYDALARMSQDWKLRYPLISFKGNNGSIDGDGPAAYRYTEARLAELSNELVRDLDEETVDMTLNFDDTEYEPIVLPARFPNLLCNGTEGIAVALATEIPPHNLKEVIDAIIYRIGHKTATVQDLRQFVLGPDFPLGGFIYKSQGLDQIYETGKGRIEVVSKCEFVTNKDNQQIIITELPYKCVKKDTVYEIDKIRHSKAIDGILEVRDESDYNGIKIVIDIKKEAKIDLIWNYLLSKTTLQTGYNANMVAICNGRPKTLNLLQFIDSYIEHQVDVITRKSKFELAKCKRRLCIVEALIFTCLNIKEVIELIRDKKGKPAVKQALIDAYNFIDDQAEAIAMMPLYKINSMDYDILTNEKKELEDTIENLNGILSDSNKLNRVLIKDLKTISDKYGDNRRTQIIDKVDSKPIDKRELIAKEDVMIAITRDGYLKKSSFKSYKGSNESLPGLKDGDLVITMGEANTVDYVICFTNKGNYITIPVHLLTENKWKDEGTHINDFVTIAQGEKIIKSYVLKKSRNDLYVALLSKLGQIKRMCLSEIDTEKHSRPQRAMKILNSDEIVGVELLSGNSNLLVLTNNGTASLFNENELTLVSSKAGGVKSINGLSNNQASALLAFEESEKGKIVIITDKGHIRVVDALKLPVTARLGKTSNICPSFKSDIHKVIGAYKVSKRDLIKLNLYLNTHRFMELTIDDLCITETQYAKKNIDEIPSKAFISIISETYIADTIDNSIVSHPIKIKEVAVDISNDPIQSDNNDDSQNNEENTLNDTNKNENIENKKEEESLGEIETISIFDSFDDN